MSKETENNQQWLVSYIDDLLDGTPDTELESVVQLSNAAIDKTDALHTPDIDRGNNQQLFIEKYTKKKAIKNQIDSALIQVEKPEQRWASGVGSGAEHSPVVSSVAADAQPVSSSMQTTANRSSGATHRRSIPSTAVNAPGSPPVAKPQPCSAGPSGSVPRFKPVEQESDRKRRVAKLLRQATLQETTLQETKPVVEKKLEQKSKSLTPSSTNVRTQVKVSASQKVAVSTAVKKESSTPVLKKTRLAEPDTQSGIKVDRSLAAGDWQNDRPAWAQKQFDVLLFSVSQLTLAVPLITLGQIQKISNNLTPLFGQTDWFMGVLPTDYGKIRCVDTALFVMPERYRAECRSQYRFVITIDGFPWGLAVDEVNQPITLQPASVNWRSSRSKRPWLAGTVKEHMCALIDVPTLGELLADQDNNRR